jgi:hypothetical protein
MKHFDGMDLTVTLVSYLAVLLEVFIIKVKQLLRPLWSFIAPKSRRLNVTIPRVSFTMNVNNLKVQPVALLLFVRLLLLPIQLTGWADGIKE